MISDTLIAGAFDHDISYHIYANTIHSEIKKILSLTKKINKIILASRFYYIAHLFISAKKSDLTSVKKLLSLGVPARGLDEFPLYQAIKIDNYEITKLLLESGANPRHYRTLFRYLAMVHGYHIAINSAAGVRTHDETPLFKAILFGGFKFVKLVVEAGADVRVNDNYALVLAVSNSGVDVVEYLIEAGANINTQNNTPIIRAVEEENLEILDCLLKYGADIHFRNDFPLFLAIANEYYDVIELLLKYGADLAADTQRILKLARDNNNQTIINLLISELNKRGILY